MKKPLIKLICIFIPVKKYRKKCRKTLESIHFPKFKYKSAKYNLIIIDDYFPVPKANTWRSAEFHQYFKSIKNTICLNIPDYFSCKYMKGGKSNEFKKRLESYLKYKPENIEFIKQIDLNTKYSASLAYLLFFNNIILMLPWLEKNKIPFVFTLYPGGGFFPEADYMKKELKKIFSSKMFRGVIVTQNFTKNYLIENNLCPEDKIAFIFGGFCQLEKEQVKPKLFYKKDKETLDICFISHKYTEKGRRKGFDLFMESAVKLSEKHKNIHFHIVGNWDDDLKDYELNDNIHYYGEQGSEFFPEFNSKMDIFLSPNRSFKSLKKYYPENTILEFDGFPFGLDQGSSGTALFCTDELGHSESFFEDGKDIVIINHNTDDICKKIEYYYKNTDKLYTLASKQQAKFQKLFSTKYQIEQRLKVLNNFLENE